MYKKLFGFVLITHIIVIAYFGLRPGAPTTESPTSVNNGSLSESSTLSETGSTTIEEDDLLEPMRVKVSYPEIGSFSEPVETELPESIKADDIKSGILYDLSNNRVLWAKNSAEVVRIASMTKMMTALLAFEDVDDNDTLSMDTVIGVTNAAYRIGGSQVWLDPRESFTLQELLISIMVKSANDSSYLVGEYLADGNMDSFIERMNTRAIELGMNSTQFLNAHGLPEGIDGNTSTCEDLVRLAAALIQFDQAIEWAVLPTYRFRANAKEPTILANHNRLIDTTEGVDGLKTGYTKAAGYCIAATCLRERQRIIAVTTGFKVRQAKRRGYQGADRLGVQCKASL